MRLGSREGGGVESSPFSICSCPWHTSAIRLGEVFAASSNSFFASGI